MKGVGEMRSNGTFLFSRLFLWCKYARLAQTFQKGGEMRSNGTLLFLSCSTGANMLDWPHLPAPFCCGRVFGQCEEGGDNLSWRFLSEITEMLSRIPSAGA